MATEGEHLTKNQIYERNRRAAVERKLIDVIHLINRNGYQVVVDFPARKVGMANPAGQVVYFNTDWRD